MTLRSTFKNIIHLPFLAAVLIGIVIITGAYIAQQRDLNTSLKAEQFNAEKRIKEVAATLSLSMAVRLNLTNSLNAFVTTHDAKFSQAEFDSFASMLQKEMVGVMSLQLAPKGIVTYLTNLEKNRKALGHNLLEDKSRNEVAEKSIREKSFIIAGPINLIQGGRAIIARRPLFLPDPVTDVDSFWGFSIVLIDIDSLLLDASIVELEKDYNIAIRGKDGKGADGAIFLGDQVTFDSAVAITDIYLPDALWQIAIAHKSKPVQRGVTSSGWFWPFNLIAAFVCAIAAYIILDKPRHLERKIDEATKHLKHEVGQRKAAEAQALFLSQHDTLTSLPNRRLFYQLSQHSIAMAKREGEKQAILFLDVDGFKLVNDNYGHEVGDNLLKQIAGRLDARIRESDVLARFGGDEFVILLSETGNPEGARKLSEEIIEVISTPFEINNNSVQVGISIGIAMYPENGATVDELIHSADSAMYGAKNIGKNNYQFYRNEG